MINDEIDFHVVIILWKKRLNEYKHRDMHKVFKWNAAESNVCSGQSSIDLVVQPHCARFDLHNKQ